MNTQEPLNTKTPEGRAKFDKRKEKIELWRKSNPDKVMVCPFCGLTISKWTYRTDNAFRCRGIECKKVIPYKLVKIRGRKNNSGGAKRRKYKDDMVYSAEEIAKVLDKAKPKIYDGHFIQTLKEIALVATLYVTARRVQELVGIENPKVIKKLDTIRKERRKRQKHFRSLGMRPQSGTYSDLTVAREDLLNSDERWIVPPVRRNQIIKEMINGQIAYTFENLPILKRRYKYTKLSDGSYAKDYPINTISLVYAYDYPMLKHLEVWLNYMDKRFPGENYVVFPFKRTTGWRYVMKIFDTKAYPHWLRHSRLSNLTKDARMTPLMLQQFVGWSSPAMSSKYVHLDKVTLFNSAFTGLQNAGKLQSQTTIEGDDKNENSG